MRVFFLGTGAAEGIPALFCDCSICTFAKQSGGKERRTRSTILIDGNIKIDLPPETLAHVHHYPQLDFANLQHLLFTHSHDDHFAVRELQYLSPNFAPSRKSPLHVYATNQLIYKIVSETEGFFERAPLMLQSLMPFFEHEVGTVSVIPIIANHKRDELCLNFLISSEGKTLLYACDTGWYDPQTWEYLSTRTLDAVILECGKGVSHSSYEGHLSVDEAIRVRDRLLDEGTLRPNAPFYLTHIAHTGLLSHEEMEKLVIPCGLKVAYDGLEIQI
jgi:phosphoribosyl 1,2-cyclic phosphate phosphodiesterase